MSAPPTPAFARQRFAHGAIVATPAALALLDQFSLSPMCFLSRHLQGDWGDLCLEDRQSNEEALANGLRIFSSYNLPAVAPADANTGGTIAGSSGAAAKLWIITEADRSVTTLLLPEDY
jgi:hypothetical protein